MAIVTVETEACYAELVWTGAETSFTAGFKAEQTSDLEVYSRDAANVVTLLTENLHYRIALAGDGAVTILPIALPAPPKTILILRDTAALQGVNFQTLGTNQAAAQTSLHSRAAMRAAEDKFHRSRAMLAPLGDAAGVLPGVRQLTILGFDAAGQPMVIDQSRFLIAGAGDAAGTLPVDRAGKLLGFAADKSPLSIPFSSIGLSINGDLAFLSVANVFIKRQVVNLNAASVTPQDDALLYAANADNANTRLSLDAFGNGVAAFSFRRALGTNGSKSALTTGSQIGIFGAAGWNGSAYGNNAARIQFVATETWDGSKNGADIRFDTTANGSTALTNRMVVTHDGALQLGATVVSSARHHTHRSYTVATLPSAAIGGEEIFVTNESGGAALAFSDGTNWRRVTDRAIVS